MRISIPYHVVLAFCVNLFAVQAHAQDFDATKWTLSERGTSVVEHLGRQSLRINNGFAILNDTSFKDGIISFDIAMPEGRGFGGVFFRWNDNTAEHFYLRSHLSGKPDSNQYTPRFNGLSGWQIYHGERYSTPSVYDTGSWTSVKLVIKDNKMDVYINSDSPSLHIDNLMAPNVAGGIRFTAARQNFHISNINIVEDTNVKTVGSASPASPFPENLITQFNVGTRALAAGDIEAMPTLDSKHLEGQNWQSIDVDESGAANLAQLFDGDRDKDTMLVKMNIRSYEDKIVPIQFGFSDRVTVFLNGKTLMHGDDTYLTRDYRHLGTVGLYDRVYLPLNSGDNELIFAVTEAFGGWAIKAAMQPVSGVTIN